MKYIKTYENLQNEFEIGSYAIAHNYFTNKHLSKNESNELKNFLENTIGIIIDDSIMIRNIGKIKIESRRDIEYINIPKDIKNILETYDIKHGNNYISILKTMLRHATPEEIEQYKIGIYINKYNL